MGDPGRPEGTHLELMTTFSSLEAEYRMYRRAADRYHMFTEKSFQKAAGLLLYTAPAAAADPAEQPGAETLTTRETQVLQLIAAGNSTKQAAAALGISFKTAAGHRSQLMKKLQIHDTASLVRFAIRAGFVVP